jgi:hypothetical protein
MQLLAGANLIGVNFSLKDNCDLFNGAQKHVSFSFSIHFILPFFS